jgi:MFS family permease
MGSVLKVYFKKTTSLGSVNKKFYMGSQNLEQTSASIKRFFNAYIIVIAGFMIMIVSWGIYYSFGIFLKPMLNEFGWTRAMISGAFSLSWLVNGLIGIFMGGLTDRYGPRIVLSICGLLAGIGYLLMSQITSFWQLYLFYGILIGAGTSTFTPLVSTIARLYVERRTMITGVVTVGIGIGSLIVPPLANQIILDYDWRVSFIILGVITMVGIVLSAQFLKRNSVEAGQSNKVNSENLQRNSSADAKAFTFRYAISTRQFWAIFAMFFCLGLSVNTMQVHIVPYATDINISATTAANILAAIGGSSILGRVVLGGMADRIGNKRAFIIGFVLMALPVLGMVFSKETWILFLIAIVFGIGYGGCIASESPLAASVFGLKSIGLIFGFLSSGYTVGAAVGPVLAGYIFDITVSYQVAFILTAFVGIAGLILTTTLSPVGLDTKGSLMKG